MANKALSTIVLITGLASILAGSLMGGILIILAGIFNIPKYSEMLQRKIPFFKEKKSRRTLKISLVLMGTLIVLFDAPTETQKERQAEKAIANYIRGNSDDPVIKLIQELTDIGKLFDNNSYALEHPHDGYIDPISDGTRDQYVFYPKLKLGDAREYLIEDSQLGFLQDCKIHFQVENGKVTLNKLIATYSKVGSVAYEGNDTPQLRNMLNHEAIALQREVKARNDKILDEKRAAHQTLTKFEKNCISEWDGSLPSLKQYIKRNMNDPSSFKHVETRYQVIDKNAFVIMEYRGTNAFGGTVTNTIKATVDYQDCSIIEIIE